MAGKGKEHSVAFLIGAKVLSSFGSSTKEAHAKMRALADSAKKTKDAWGKAGKAWKDFGQSVIKVGTAVVGAAAAIGGAAYGMANAVAEVGAEAHNTSAALGMTAEDLQELRYAFGTAGMESTEFDNAVKNMNKNLLALSKDKKAEKKLAEFGLSAKKLQAMDPALAIERLSDYFSAMKTPADKARAAATLFGEEAGPRMLAAMEMGSSGLTQLRREAQKTGSVVDNEAAKQAAAYEKSKQQMQKTFEGIRNQIGSRLLPVFIRAFDRISKKIQDNMPQIEKFAEMLASGIADVIPKVIEIIKGIVDFGKRIGETVNRVKDFVGGWENLAKIVAGVIGVVLAIKALVAIVTTLMAVWQVINLLFVASPIGWIILAVIALAAGIYLLVKHWDLVKTKMREFYNSAPRALKVIIDVYVSAGKAVVSFFTWVFTTAKQRVHEMVQTFDIIITFFTAVWETARGIFQAFCLLFQGDFTGFITKLSETWAGLTKGLDGINEKIRALFKPTFDWFGERFEWIKGGWDKVISFFGGSKPSVPNGGPIPGHATGGIFTRPHPAWVAEGGDAESIIPINNSARAAALYQETGRRLSAVNPGALRAAPGGGGGTVVHYTVKNTFTGEVSPQTVKQVETASRTGVKDLAAWLKGKQADEERVEF